MIENINRIQKICYSSKFRQIQFHFLFTILFVWLFKLYRDKALENKSHKTYIHSFSLFANHHILYMNNFILQWQKKEILHRVDTFVKIVKTNFSLCPLFCFSCNKTSQRKLSLSCKNLIQIRITFLILVYYVS